MATTAICNSWKTELLSGAHCFLVTLSRSGTTHTNTTLDGLGTTDGIVVGMAATGGDIAASSFIADITDAGAVVLSKAASGGTTASRTFTGDAFKLLLIKVAPTRTFDKTQTNVGTPGSGGPTAANVGTDEVAAGGNYSSGGVALANVTPVLSTDTAVCDFADVSWSSATFSATAAVIYNTTRRLGAAATPINNRSVSVHDFGGTQSVSAGTFTIVFPTPDASNAILRIA